MFRIKKEYSDYVTKSFRLPVELVEQMSVLAQKKNISLNKLVIQCCEYALENLDENDTE